jgi:hypothetical protein
LAQEFIDPLAREQAQPPPGDLFIRPLSHHIGPSPQDNMHMVRNDGIGQNIDLEDLG